METDPQPAGKQERQSTKWKRLTVGFASSDHVLMIIFGRNFLYHKNPPTASCSAIPFVAALSVGDDGIRSFICPWKRNENSN